MSDLSRLARKGTIWSLRRRRPAIQGHLIRASLSMRDSAGTKRGSGALFLRETCETAFLLNGWPPPPGSARRTGGFHAKNQWFIFREQMFFRWGTGGDLTHRWGKSHMVKTHWVFRKPKKADKEKEIEKEREIDTIENGRDREQQKEREKKLKKKML